MEFALVLPIVLLALLAVVEVVVVARVQLEISHAAREGAREAAAVPDTDRAIAAARRALGAQLAPHARVAVQREGHVGGAARVTVSLSHRVAALLVGGFPVHLEATAVMRVER